MSEASYQIDTDQSVALIAAKVTNDTDRWKSVTETSIDTDNNHVRLYQVVWCVLHLVAYYYSGRAVLIVLIMEEEEEMVGRKFNTLKELGPSA